MCELVSLSRLSPWVDLRCSRSGVTAVRGALACRQGKPRGEESEGVLGPSISKSHVVQVCSRIGAPMFSFVQRSLPLLLALLFYPLRSLAFQGQPGPAQSGQPATPLLQIMTGELHRDMDALKKSAQENQPAPYFISYDVHDRSATALVAEEGAILNSSSDHERSADIIVRVGDPKLDNTHGTHRASAIHSVLLPLSDDRVSLQRALWLGTNTEYGNAVKAYLQVKADSTVHAREEDASADFSAQPSTSAYSPAPPAAGVDVSQWAAKLRAISATYRSHPRILNNLVLMAASTDTDTFVSSEGSRVTTSHQNARIVMLANARADDGSEVMLVKTFESRTTDGLPSAQELENAAGALANEVEHLRTAPAAEPFDGPALLSGRAAAVFFHEVLGHRLEGQRQRGSNEGETFTKSVGKPILPTFLSVTDDPSMPKFGDTFLSGYYAFDDEGQPAQRVPLIKDGVLQEFLMSRMPIASFSTSNGHGRAQPGKMPTGRQGNLIVTSSKTESDAELRKQFIQEIKKQGKPYGLYFADISSGFTLTQRVTPQAFQVIPLLVYRVYPDGRPDELVRGVSIVGTPQAALTRILATGDKPAVFNGECGAESGTVPVSAVAPAMLFSEIETQKTGQGSSRPPILPAPGITIGEVQ